MAEAVVAALKREYKVIDLKSKNPVLLDVAVADQVPLMLVWFHSEGGGTHNNNFFNPLNTKRGAGAIYKNGYFPVFGNCQDGVDAILKTITNRLVCIDDCVIYRLSWSVSWTACPGFGGARRTVDAYT